MAQLLEVTSLNKVDILSQHRKSIAAGILAELLRVLLLKCVQTMSCNGLTSDIVITIKVPGHSHHRSLMPQFKTASRPEQMPPNNSIKVLVL